jgi:modulator of FtsH protease
VQASSFVRFASALEGWHDFYLAVGSASAALLGLLFVAVSINLAAITAAERADLRARANVAFSNLLYLLILALIMLIPDEAATGVVIGFAVLGAGGLVRSARRVPALVRRQSGAWRRLGTWRQIVWTVVADLLLLLIAASLAMSGDPDWLYVTLAVVFVLLIGAADVAWDLLVRESEEAATRR